MDDSKLHVGDILRLKVRYADSAVFGIIIEINKAENFGPGGWISFDYLIMNEKEELVHISEACVDEVLYSHHEK